MDDEKLTEFRSSLNLYTPLHEAKEEIWRRWNDKALRKEVGAYLGDIPDLFKETPHAMLWRWIATPNFEAQRFLELSSQVELTPVFLEYYGDKFVTCNPDKLHLGKLVFCQRNNGSLIKSHFNIIDINENQGKTFREIKTPRGSQLIEIHRKLWDCSTINMRVIDLYPCLSCKGVDIIERYKFILAFFICHGILFENFIIKASRMYEYEFTRDIVLPAFRAVEKRFGLKPIIVPLFTEEEEEDLYWQYYPAHLQKEVEELKNGVFNTNGMNAYGK